MEQAYKFIYTTKRKCSHERSELNLPRLIGTNSIQPFKNNIVCMKIMLLIVAIFSCNIISSQFQLQKVEIGLPLPNQTNVTRMDTLVKNCSCGSISKEKNGNQIDSCKIEYILEYHYEGDSTIIKTFWISSGQKICNKKYGKWSSSLGYYNENERVYNKNYEQYYINDYEIIKDKSITKKIEVNSQNKTAYCDFIYFHGQNDTIEMRVDYWLNKDTVFAKCRTLKGIELFCTNIAHIDDEFRLLFEGYYNRKIYHQR